MTCHSCKCIYIVNAQYTNNGSASSHMRANFKMSLENEMRGGSGTADRVPFASTMILTGSDEAEDAVPAGAGRTGFKVGSKGASVAGRG
jgi:hypothetical protein